MPTVFGRRYADYVRFQRPWLLTIAAVGALRLVLSLVGVPDSVVRFLPMTLINLCGVVYYGLRVGPTGFGSYRHLLPLVLNQNLVVNGIAILGIVLAALGLPNIYDTPEFRPPFGRGPTTSPASHALAHLVIGNTVPTLINWGLGSLVMLIAGRPGREPEPDHPGAPQPL
jgi:hypothetical protein